MTGAKSPQDHRFSIMQQKDWKETSGANSVFKLKASKRSLERYSKY